MEYWDVEDTILVHGFVCNTPILRGISLQEKSLRSKQDQGLKLDRTPKEDFS
jgi:hypothetical protein